MLALSSSVVGDHAFDRFLDAVELSDPVGVFTSCRRATIATDDPGSGVSATIRRFNASGHCRRFVELRCLVSASTFVDTSDASSHPMIIAFVGDQRQAPFATYSGSSRRPGCDYSKSFLMFNATES